MRTTTTKEVKRGRGRPPLDDSERREHTRAARLTAAECDQLAQLARDEGIAEGEVLRRALSAYAAKRSRS